MNRKVAAILAKEELGKMKITSSMELERKLRNISVSLVFRMARELDHYIEVENETGQRAQLDSNQIGKLNGLMEMLGYVRQMDLNGQGVKFELTQEGGDLHDQFLKEGLCKVVDRGYCFAEQTSYEPKMEIL
tara:strand:- start:3266 stop:3661 length:396 start_codon:yes stop_codon:yes gene_type:complete